MPRSRRCGTGALDKFLFAANEDSDTVNLFKRDATSGRLAGSDQSVHVGSPVCILFETL